MVGFGRSIGGYLEEDLIELDPIILAYSQPSRTPEQGRKRNPNITVDATNQWPPDANDALI